MRESADAHMKQKLAFLSDIVILALYTVHLYLLWRICLYGGAYYSLSRLAPLPLLLIAIVILRLIIRFKGYRAQYFRIRLSLFIAISLLFSGMIAYTAIPYNGALSWRIDSLLHHQKITLTHNNIYTDGVKGLLDDVRQKVSLPEELYVSNNFKIDFTGDGTIKRIDTLLFGENSKGQLKGFLLSYNSKKADKIDVWLNDGEGLLINPDRSLRPFYTILEQSSYKDQVRQWGAINHDQTYVLSYSGKRDVTSGDRFYILDASRNENETYATGPMVSTLPEGGLIRGYEASLYISGNKKESSIRFLVDAESISQEAREKEHTDHAVEDAKNSKSWFTDSSDGTVYHFVTEDKQVGYRLVVDGAAAGSRFYSLEKSRDGGKSWETINQNPFLNELGVAEGIIFFSDDFGFIGIQGASGQHSQLHMTKDGGLNFTQITLPMEQVTDIPQKGKEYGLEIKDYQYISMPQQRDDKIFLTVTTGENESDGIEFYSEDLGETWNQLK